MGFGIGAHTGGGPSRGDLKRVARKGKMMSHYNRFDKLLDERKDRNVKGQESRLFYRMYRAKNPNRRKAIHHFINDHYVQGGSGGGHSTLTKEDAMTKAMKKRVNK